MLRQAAAARDGFVEYLQDRIARLEAASKSERRDVDTEGEAAEASQSVETAARESTAHQKLRQEISQLRDIVEQQLKQHTSAAAARGSPVTPNGSGLHAANTAADSQDQRRQISVGRITGSPCLHREPETSSKIPQVFPTQSSSRASRGFAPPLRMVSDTIERVFEV